MHAVSGQNQTTFVNDEMNIQDLERLYAKLPQVSALAREIEKSSVRAIFLEGLLGSSAPMLFASMVSKCKSRLLFVLQDAEEAGYFYHDLTQLLGSRDVLFFPSSYRRAIKYAQRDAASEILRTEVMARLAQQDELLYVVTYPEALAELVVSKKSLDSRTLVLEKDQTMTRPSMLLMSRKHFVTLVSVRWIMSMSQGSLLFAVLFSTFTPLVVSIPTVLISSATILTLSVLSRWKTSCRRTIATVLRLSRNCL